MAVRVNICGGVGTRLLTNFLQMSNTDKHRDRHVCGLRIMKPKHVAVEPPGFFEVDIGEFSVGKDTLTVGAEFGWVRCRVSQSLNSSKEIKESKTAVK